MGNNKISATTLGKIADIITGPFGTQLHVSDYVETGIPVIMPQNIKDRGVDITNIANINIVDYNRLNRYKTQRNDIIYARRGDVEKHAFIDFDGQMLCGTGCFRVRINRTDIFPPYISFFLNAPQTRRWIAFHAVGTNMPNLNTDILASVPIEFPNYDKQVKIGQFLTELEKQIRINHRINDNLAAQLAMVA